MCRGPWLSVVAPRHGASLLSGQGERGQSAHKASVCDLVSLTQLGTPQNLPPEAPVTGGSLEVEGNGLQQ